MRPATRFSRFDSKNARWSSKYVRRLQQFDALTCLLSVREINTHSAEGQKGTVGALRRPDIAARHPYLVCFSRAAVAGIGDSGYNIGIAALMHVHSWFAYAG
jgi:hypothetical protein